MLKSAIIGVSGYGRFIYNLMKEAQDQGLLNISAAVIRTPSKAQDVYDELKAAGASIFSSADEMFDALKGKIDLVCIPTGIETHRPLTIAAMKAGAHVMVEKPLAGTLEEIEEMMEAKKKGSFRICQRLNLYPSLPS